MSTGSDWEKHRGIALGIASEFDIPGMDAQDVRQEALIALWMASRSHNHELGSIKPWMRRVVRARMIDLLRRATREKRSAKVFELWEEDAVQEEDPSEQLRSLVELLPELSELERATIKAKLDGTYDASDRRQDNALQRVRRKWERA